MKLDGFHLEYKIRFLIAINFAIITPFSFSGKLKSRERVLIKAYFLILSDYNTLNSVISKLFDQGLILTVNYISIQVLRETLELAFIVNKLSSKITGLSISE